MRSLTFKVTLGFLAVILTGAVMVAVVARQATVTAFDSFVIEQALTDFIEQAEAYYRANQTWKGVENQFLRPDAGPHGLPGPGGGSQPVQPRPGVVNQPPRLPPNLFVLVDQDGRVVLPGGRFRMGNRLPVAELENGTVIEIEGEAVGTVLVMQPDLERDPNEQRYLERTNQALLYAAIGGTVIALALGIFLARTLTRPMRELTTAIRDMGEGELGQQVPVRSQDELGQLAAAFNEMSADLARSNALRRQMTADIAHDLRTPLTVISGYLESLRDGVLEPTPERIDVIFNESQHLLRLVEDLRTLSLADAGELTLHHVSVSPKDLLERVANTYNHQAQKKDIDLRVQTQATLPEVDVDLDRMVQVMGNLISNALRHTPEGGVITLAAGELPGGIALTVKDTGEGIPEREISKVFDRFYRGEFSRQQAVSESGLGLAIARSIVAAHGGTIGVESAVGEGTIFTIVLPVSP